MTKVMSGLRKRLPGGILGLLIGKEAKRSNISTSVIVGKALSDGKIRITDGRYSKCME